MVARTLFMGVKQSLPGIKATIATARTTVKTAGKTAASLLDQALAAVDALRDVLSQVMAQIQLAIDKLVALLIQLQNTLVLAQEKLVLISQKMHAAVDAIKPKPEALIDQVVAVRDDFLSKAAPHEKIQALHDKVLSLTAQALTPVKAQIEEVGTQAHGLIDKAKAQLTPPADAMQTKLDELDAHLATLRVQIEVPGQRLRTLLDQALVQVNASLNQGRAALDKVLDQAETKINIALQRGEDMVDQALTAFETQNTLLNEGLQQALTQVDAQLAGLPPVAQQLLQTARDKAEEAGLDVKGLEAKVQTLREETETALQKPLDDAQSAAGDALAEQEKLVQADEGLQDSAKDDSASMAQKDTKGKSVPATAVPQHKAMAMGKMPPVGTSPKTPA
jgi:phosphate uptake regulator